MEVRGKIFLFFFSLFLRDRYYREFSLYKPLELLHVLELATMQVKLLFAEQTNDSGQEIHL